MLQLLIVVGRALALGLRGHRELVLENLALRQRLMAMKRANSRPRLQPRDRLCWIALRRIWTNWRTAVVLVRPETVVDTSAIADVADLPDESPRVSRLDGLLHGVDARGTGALRLRGALHHRRRILHLNTTAHSTAE
jgi:hypothetical protein